MELENPADKDQWEKRSFGSSANTLTGYVAKNRFYDLGASACHGTFSRSQFYARKNSEYVEQLWSRKMPNNCKDAADVEEIYYPWLLNESPWAQAFVEKDYKKAKNHGFSLRADLPYDYVASSVVATRWLTERYSGYGSWTTKRIPLYKKLLSDIGPLWAFIMANLYAPKGGSLERFSFVMQSGHEMLPSTLTVEGLKKFISGKHSAGESFARNQGYSSIGTTWGSAGESITTLAKDWRFDKKAVVDLNLFRKPDLEGGYPVLSYKDLVNLVPILKELVNDPKVA